MRIEVNEEAGRRRVDDPALPDTAVMIEQHDFRGVIRSGLVFSLAAAIQIPNHERVRS
jgi:hypothetical protein